MSERARLSPVPGLKRTSQLPSPPPRRVRAVASSVPTEVDEAGVDQEAGAPATETTPQPQPHPGAADGDKVRALSISLPLNLAEAIKLRAKADKCTQADVLLDAIVVHREELDALVQAVKPQPRSDGLFVRSATRAPVSAYVSLSLRMPASNVQIIDALAERHGADSRSQFCAAILAAYL